MARLTGKVALITGGASGLGAATARRFAIEQASVVITDVQEGLGRQIAAEIPGALFIDHDVRDEAQWQHVAAKTASQFGRIDILVNNAGLVRPGSVEQLSYDDFRLQIDVMLGGTFLGCKTIIPFIEKAGGGSIVNMASVGGIKGIGAIPAYSGAKGGVIAMTRSIAVYCLDAANGIRVNAIAPGGIDTPMLAQFSLGAQLRRPASVPVEPRGTPDDVANLVLFLASDESRHITGALIPVDNGSTVR